MKKTNEWRGNKEKPVENSRTLNENYEKSRKATDKKNIPITIVLAANNNTQETNKPLTDGNNKIATRKYGKTHKNAPNEHNKCYFSDLTVEDLMV